MASDEEKQATKENIESGDSKKEDVTPAKAASVEKEQEAQLRAKYPALKGPGSQFLQKRLSKGAKYFDSGDYNMAKAKMGPKGRVPVGSANIDNRALATEQSVTGDTIPTPESVPVRKTSIVQSRIFDHPQQSHVN